MMLLFALALLAAQCDQDYTEGTDSYEVCITGEEIDLTPIQDEADTVVSKARNEQES